MMNDLQKEWAILHDDIDKFERYSLIIKLISISLSMFALLFHLSVWLAAAFILILWLQDGIWTTFQKRLEARILYLEDCMQSDSEQQGTAQQGTAFTLYSQWSSQRQGAFGVIKEYILNSLKPTVAYPYAILLVLMLVAYQFLGY